KTVGGNTRGRSTRPVSASPYMVPSGSPRSSGGRTAGRSTSVLDGLMSRDRWVRLPHPLQYGSGTPRVGTPRRTPWRGGRNGRVTWLSPRVICGFESRPRCDAGRSLEVPTTFRHDEEHDRSGVA